MGIECKILRDLSGEPGAPFLGGSFHGHKCVFGKKRADDTVAEPSGSFFVNGPVFVPSSGIPSRGTIRSGGVLVPGYALGVSPGAGDF